MKQPDPVVERVANALFESIKCSDYAWMDQRSVSLGRVDIDGECDLYAAARAAIAAIVTADDPPTETVAPVQPRVPPPGTRIHCFDIQWKWHWGRCRFAPGRRVWHARADSNDEGWTIAESWEWA